MTTVLEEDLQIIYSSLSSQEKRTLEGKTILVTGFAGSLGYEMMAFFRSFGDELGIQKVYGVDNYIFGKPSWIRELEGDQRFELMEADIIDFDLERAADADLIFHMASLASPVYYRQHPIETMDADVAGLRRLLDFFKDRKLHDLLFFSTSEIYGDPADGMVPTSERYWGNVNPCGPRACYDESKRFGETLCYNFANVYHMPVTVIRPFNSFGPGLRTNDKRVVADFALNVLGHEDIVIYSNGKATRTFCYAADTVTGILKCALYGKYDVFNIGSDKKEMTVDELAQIYKETGNRLNGFQKSIVYQTHEDRHYLTDNPKRRCPDLDKAKKVLSYQPKYTAEEGVERYLRHLMEDAKEQERQELS